MHWTFPYMVASAGLACGTYLVDLATRPTRTERVRARACRRRLARRVGPTGGLGRSAIGLVARTGAFGRPTRVVPSRLTTLLVALALGGFLHSLVDFGGEEVPIEEWVQGPAPEGSSIERTVRAWSQDVRVVRTHTPLAPDAALREILDAETASLEPISRPEGWALAIPGATHEVWVEARSEKDGGTGTTLRYRVQGREAAAKDRRFRER